MNILFFILPKDKAEYVLDTFTLRQTYEKLENSGYTALPVINSKGEYISTITEGDILRYIKRQSDFSLKKSEKTPIKEVEILRDVKSIKIYANMEDLLEVALEQNFIPVVDDMNHFIGIITRRAIMSYFAKKEK